MWTETKIQKETIENHKFCDVCGIELEIGLACSAAHCMYCGKDLCNNCIGHEDTTPGDYRDVYCKKCWELGNQYRPIIEELQLKIEVLYKEWQDKCKCSERGMQPEKHFDPDMMITEKNSSR